MSDFDVCELSMAFKKWSWKALANLSEELHQNRLVSFADDACLLCMAEGLVRNAANT